MHESRVDRREPCAFTGLWDMDGIDIEKTMLVSLGWRWKRKRKDGTDRPTGQVSVR